MARICRRWLAAATLAILPTVAQADLYMLIPGVSGDSVAKGHEKWIRVSSFDWEVEAATTWTAGGGASVGKPKPGDFTMLLPTGSWSQQFVRMITQGKAVPSIVIDATATDGRPLYRATAEGVFVTKYGLTSPAAAPLPQDRIEGVFKKVKIEYYATASDGRLVTSTVEWDVVTGVSTPTL